MSKSKISKYLVGIDEVGRGPIAGPVAVGVFIFLDDSAKRFFYGVKESKQLNEIEREEWFKKIMEIKKLNLINFFVSFQSEKIIDKIGISFSIKKCIENSMKKIIIEPEKLLILLDGGLKAPSKYLYQKTIIKGDEKELVIALASICAKVLRDRKMKKISEKYPKYKFWKNKGYGTKEHYDSIASFNISPVHRKSFIKRHKILQKTHI